MERPASLCSMLADLRKKFVDEWDVIPTQAQDVPGCCECVWFRRTPLSLSCVLHEKNVKYVSSLQTSTIESTK